MKKRSEAKPQTQLEVALSSVKLLKEVFPQLDAVHQRVVRERLLDEIEGAALDRSHGCGHVAMAGQEDHRHALRQAARGQLVESRHAVHVRHAHVEQHAVAVGIEMRGCLVEKLVGAGIAARLDAA